MTIYSLFLVIKPSNLSVLIFHTASSLSLPLPVAGCLLSIYYNCMVAVFAICSRVLHVRREHSGAGRFHLYAAWERYHARRHTSGTLYCAVRKLISLYRFCRRFCLLRVYLRYSMPWPAALSRGAGGEWHRWSPFISTYAAVNKIWRARQRFIRLRVRHRRRVLEPAAITWQGRAGPAPPRMCGRHCTAAALSCRR